MPFFAEGLDSHGKCCTTVAIIQSLFEESRLHHLQSDLSPQIVQECAETAGYTLM